MKWKKKQRKVLIFIFAACVLVWGGGGKQNHVVFAASGSIYTCKISSSYEHPVTGAIEDSGGSSSKATGQGMAESAVFTKGILEKTESGVSYLTFRMSLMDYTSKHSFSVQKVGDSKWTTAADAKTATGINDNGKTTDYRIKVPSENSVIRCSMYVEPMGRNVIFYFYPSDYTAGNTAGMKATKVTAESTESTQSTESTTEESVLEDAQGLSLSTQSDSTDKSSKTSTNYMIQQIAVMTTSITVSGLILLTVAAGIVYYFRKNWERWGGDKDEYDGIYKENET